MNSMVAKRLEQIFSNIKSKSDSIINENSDIEFAAELITSSVSSELNMRMNALLSDVYAELSEKTLHTKEFTSNKNKNIFYEAKIDTDIYKKYRFDIDSLDTFARGIQAKYLNSLYLSAAAAAGTGAVGGILTYSLFSSATIPFVVAIAGAIAAFCIAYFKAAPRMNRIKFQSGLERFLNDLKNEIGQWFLSVEEYYVARVQELTKNIEM